MSIETILLAIPIALTLHIVRHNADQVRSVWREARWYEKLALCLLFVPIPGPIDEIVAVLAIKRVCARRSSMY